MSDDQACEVPFVEQLRSVPKDCRLTIAIQWAEDGAETGHQFIPVGFMMHRAADEIERLQYDVSKGMANHNADLNAPVTEALAPTWQKAEDGKGRTSDIHLSLAESKATTEHCFVTLRNGDFYEYRVTVPPFQEKP